jgi:hypothetical protein
MHTTTLEVFAFRMVAMLLGLLMVVFRARQYNGGKEGKCSNEGEYGF